VRCLNWAHVCESTDPVSLFVSQARRPLLPFHMARRLLFTIGHSTRGWEEFTHVLRAWKIQQVVDVRTVPRSATFPQFEKKHLANALPKAGIAYVHMPELGGLRHARKDSPNTAWRNASFRGYADYMQTPEFAGALRQLNALQKGRRLCLMCAEAVWWRCHRRLIADAETARGIPVRHIFSATVAKPHEVTAFAVIKRRRGHPPELRYP